MEWYSREGKETAHQTARKKDNKKQQQSKNSNDPGSTRLSLRGTSVDRSGLTGTDEQIGVAVCAHQSSAREVGVVQVASQAWLDWHPDQKITLARTQRAASARKNCHVPPFLALLAGLLGVDFAVLKNGNFGDVALVVPVVPQIPP